MGIPFFIKQLALRTSTIFLVKLLGFFARIPLFRLLGPEGIGLYQMAYSVYGLMLTLLIGGFPTALAITTSKDPENGWRIFKRLSIILLLISSITAGITYHLSPEIARLLGDPELDFSIQCLAPAIIIVPTLSLFRGYLQGMERFGIIAFSEVIEQIVRIGVMLFFVFLWIRHGIEIAVGGVTLGPFAGSMMAFLFLLIFYLKEEEGLDKSRSLPIVASRIFDANTLLFLNTSFAIAGTRILIPVSDFLDALIIPHRLQDTGMSVTAAVSLYGEIAGMAAIVAYIPTILTAALTHTIMAKMASDWQKKRMDRFVLRCQNALVFGWFWGVGSGLFLYFYANEISLLMFGTDSISNAIRLLSLAPLLGGLRDISTSVLWIIGKKKEPLVGLICGIIVSVLLNYYLVAIPGISSIGIVMGLLSIDFFAAFYAVFVLFRSKLTIPLRSLFLESMCFFTILYSCFCVIRRFLFAEDFSLVISDVLQMLVSYGVIFLYLFIRFFKTYSKIS